MKRLLSFVLAMAMAISCVQWGALPLTVWGEEDTSNTTWTNLADVIEGFDAFDSGFYSVPSGNYYLASDYTLTSGLVIATDAQVTLNLNNKILTIGTLATPQIYTSTLSDSGIVVYGGSFTLVDSPVDGADTTARYWDGSAIVTGTNPADDSETTNFTGGAITGGYNDRSVLGGGAICVYSGSFTMAGGNLVGNATSTTGILGGAVYVNATATFTMEDGSIIGNTSGGLAGAVYIQCNGTFTFEDGVIAHNSTGTTANYAGAVYNVGTFIMNGGLLDSNESMGGGAVSTVAGWKDGSGVFTMNGGEITGNYAATAGGAVLIGSGGSFVMNDGSITGNTTGGAGGGINLLYDNSTASIYGGTITDNTATGVAGGIRVNGGILNIGNIGQSGTTPITITANTGDGVESNVYLFSGSTITQVGTLDAATCAVGVTLQSGTGTAAISGSHTITVSNTQDDVAAYSSDEGYYRILSGDTVILLEAGTVPGTDTETAYSADAYNVAQLFTYATDESFGTATYTITPITGEGKVNGTAISGSASITVDSVTDAAYFTITQIGTFAITVQTSYTTTAEPKIGSATLTVTPSSNIEITWPTASDFVYGGNQAVDSLLDASEASVVIKTVSGDDETTTTSVAVEGTFTWLDPITATDDLQDAGGYTGTVIFTPSDTQTDGYDGTYNADFAAITGEVTYNITPRDVTVSGLVALERGPMAGVYSVTLDTDKGSIGGVAGDDDSGIINEDTVSISFSSYSATINDTSYHSSSNAAYYSDGDPDNTADGNYTGEGVFDVTVTGLTLTGADAANYTLVTIAPTTVTIAQSTPYVAWPTATNITYGQTQGDSTLNGGKVYLQNAADADGNITYTDITDLGSFVWVTPNTDTENPLDAGTYTGTVQFVLNSDITEDDASYKTALEALTREIDYLIEAAPVCFTVTNNSVAYGSYVNPSISVVSSGTAPAPVRGTDYTVQYLQLVDGVYEYVTSPTEIGTYFIGIGFESVGTDASGNLLYNYYHTGTSVSTAKQIGVLVIYDYEEAYVFDGDGLTKVTADPPETYTLRFTGFTAADTTCYDVSDALPQTIHILPTLDTDAYLGWEDAQGTFYAFGSRYPQPEYDMVFTAVLAPDSHTISGTVTGYDLGDTTDTGDAADTVTTLSKVSVVLMSGNDQIATTTTDESGNYAFTVLPGRYTVEFTLDYGDIKYIESVFVDVTDGDADVDMYFPKERFNVELNLGAGMDGITVDGLQDILNELSAGKTVENSVVFGITQVDVSSGAYTDLMTAAATDGLGADNVKLFYDVQITEEKAVGTVTEVDTVDTLFAIYIPLSGIYQAKETYVVYRNDGSTIDKLTTTKNTAGEYIALADDGQTLVIYAKASALYAISFTEPAPSSLAGVDVTQVYSTASIDVTALGMFDLTGLGEASYTITADTGAGAVVGNYLKVSSVGTFTVTVSTAATATALAMQGSATLTITPKEIDVANLVGESRGPVEDNYYVELDATASAESNTLIGVINSDDVSIDTDSYAQAYGRIVDEDYTDADYYISTIDDTTTITTATFAIAAGGLALDGEDKDNYVLSDASGAVTISISEPYIAWPTAPDINYHDDLGDSVLYGGKVIVLDADSGQYIQLDGTFEWLDEKEWVDEKGDVDATVANSTDVDRTDIGTYTQYVRFVESVATQDDANSYNTALESAVHAVEVTIKATSVSFAVTGSDVVYDGSAHTVTVVETSSSGEDLVQGVQGTAADTENGIDAVADTGDYIIQYYQFAADNSIVYVDAPTEVGTYFVAAYFTSANYHHTGTLEYTGKQIGVLYIRAADSEVIPTYSITFADAGDWDGDTLSGIYAEDIHNLPTITNADGTTSTDYIGWLYNGSVYDFGARLAQPAADIVLTPVAAPDSFAVSGTVYGEDLDGTKDAALSNIAVAVMQGAETIATLETGADGSFSIDLPAGYYTVVITRDQVVYNEVSIHIEVTNAAIVLDDIVLPDTAQNTVLEIASGVSVTSVDGLDSMLDYYLAEDADLPSAVSNTITVEINNIDIVNEAAELTQYNAIMAEASKYSINADNLKLFFDVSVWRSYGIEDAVQISTIPDDAAILDDGYLEIYITLPGTYQGDYTYQVYRYHTYDSGESQVDVLTTKANAFGEKIELMADGQTLKVTAKFYSVYGVAYLPIEESDSDDGKTQESGSTGSTTSSSSSSTSVTDVPTSPATGETGVIARIIAWFTALLK